MLWSEQIDCRCHFYTPDDALVTEMDVAHIYNILMKLGWSLCNVLQKLKKKNGYKNYFVMLVNFRVYNL
jgi:hypothetical protein